MGHEVTIANPRNVKLITASDRKNDRADAKLLAKLGRADIELLSPVQHRGEQEQADLAVAKVRDALVRCRTMLINQARGLAKSFGYRLPKCDASCFFSRTRQAVPDVLESALAPLYESLEELARQIAALDSRIEELAKTRYPDTAVVSQMHGVGLLTALVFILTLEDKTRFKKSRDVGAFVGLSPGSKQSGASDPQMHITKAGDGFLRKLLIQSSHYILGPLCRQDSDLRGWGLQLAKCGGKAGKKRARAATARKLAVLMHRLWVSGEVYQPLGYNSSQAKTIPA